MTAWDELNACAWDELEWHQKALSEAKRRLTMAADLIALLDQLPDYRKLSEELLANVDQKLAAWNEAVAVPLCR